MLPLHAYIERVAENPICGYHPHSQAATEPTAIAALAMLAVNRCEAAQRAAHWLVQVQSHCGSLGVTVDQGEPCWPTALALIVWHELVRVEPDAILAEGMARAVEWLQLQAGETQTREPGIGHDSTLVGWPWVSGTHSWIEPSAWAVLALKKLGLSDHPRCRQGVQLLLDRQLPAGGCNFGNTLALGHLTLPHLQPTAMALLALQAEGDDGRWLRSLAYLERSAATATGVSSVCYTAMALRAHGKPFPELDHRIDAALEQAGDRAGVYYWGLTILALTEANCLTRLGPPRSLSASQRGTLEKPGENS